MPVDPGFAMPTIKAFFRVQIVETFLNYAAPHSVRLRTCERSVAGERVAAAAREASRHVLGRTSGLAREPVGNAGDGEFGFGSHRQTVWIL
jgi:hypothetical protein